VGRGKELEKINQHFENKDKIGVVGLIGDGGFGKSALTEQWVLEIEKQGFGGLKRVLAWSFYSQGSHQRTFSSSQDFFAEMKEAVLSTTMWFPEHLRVGST